MFAFCSPRISYILNSTRYDNIRVMKWWLMVTAVIQAIGMPMVLADVPLKSNNYELNETFVGGSGLVQEGSATYRVGESIGDTVIGSSQSGNYQLKGGYTTTNAPTLSFIVNTAAVPLGVLSLTSTQTGTASFSVLNYTSYGYIVQSLGDAPTYAGHALNTPTTSGGAPVGTEQFGINLAANTLPASLAGISHGPQQVPSSSFSNGGAYGGYAVANQFQYHNGDIIAQASKSSGETDYTISYVANTAPLTPAGEYVMNQTLICTGTY